MIRPSTDGLVMQQLRYGDEVRPFSEVPMDNANVTEAELALALQIIAMSTSETFAPGKYENRVQARLESIIQGKIAGEDHSFSPAAEPKAQLIDLMAALKASLDSDKVKPAKSAAGAAEAEDDVASAGG